LSHINGHRTPLAAGRSLQGLGHTFYVVSISQPASYGSCTVHRPSYLLVAHTARVLLVLRSLGRGEDQVKTYIQRRLSTTLHPQEKTPRSPSAQNSCPVAAPISTTTPPLLNQKELPDSSRAARSSGPLHSCVHCPREGKGECTCGLRRTLFRSAAPSAVGDCANDPSLGGCTQLVSRLPPGRTKTKLIKKGLPFLDLTHR
jgi:hypothetical protein